MYKDMCPVMPFLLIAAGLLISSLGCQGAFSGEGFLDNEHLPVGDKMAVIVSGILPRWGAEVFWPLFMRHVFFPAGGLQVVDLYLHVQSWSADITSDEIMGDIKGLIPHRNLKMVAVHGPGAEAELHTREWKPLWRGYLQFFRLRETFGHVLGQELLQGSRYRHVVRMRPDSIWSVDWPAAETLQNHVPPGYVGGPAYDRPGHKRDMFWIASREVAWRAFLLMPLFFERLDSISREDYWSVVGCDLRNNTDDYLWDGKTRACESCLNKNPIAWGTCPEIVVPYAWKKMGLEMVNICNYTMGFAVAGRHAKLDVLCSEWEVSGLLQGFIQETARYGKFDPPFMDTVVDEME